MTLEAAVHVLGQYVRQELALWQQLAVGQLTDGIRVGQVQLEEDALGAVEGLARVLRNVVPDARVGHMDGAEEVGGGLSFDGPQERIELTLL